MNVQPLGSDVANFQSPADAILTQIAGARGIPKRILTGSEMGELASSQDRDNWKDQVNGRQTQYAGPYIVRPLVDRLLLYGYLPPPKAEGQYEVVWPHIEVMTETEKGQIAQQMAAVNQAMGMPVFISAEIRDHAYKWEPLTDKQIDDEIALKEKATPKPPEPAEPPAAIASEKAEPEEAEDEDEEPVAAEALPILSETEREVLRVLEAAVRCDNQEVVRTILGEEFRVGEQQ